MSWIIDEINSCKCNIQNDLNEINRIKRLIDSLESFEAEVIGVNRNFYEINSSKASYANGLVENVFHNICNEKYSKGITTVLKEVGEDGVGYAFEHLLSKIRKQLYDYYEQIDALNRDISHLEARIDELYAILRREEEEARRRQYEK